MQLYRKVSLSLNSRDVRILELQLSEKEDAPLVACLRAHSLDDQPSYSALSYTWGRPDFDYFLTCNDLQFPITHNLFLALKRLRKSGKTLLWVDQICIDQSNVEERNAQVSLMSSIYKNATDVCVWLGPHTDDTGPGIGLARRLAWSPTKMTTQNGHDNKPDHMLAKPEQNPEWFGFYSLFESPWFLRCWVVQEVLAKPKVTAFCGDFEFDWRILPFALLTLYSNYLSHFNDGANTKTSTLAERGMTCCNSMAYEFGDLEKEYPFMHSISDTLIGKAVHARYDTIDIFLSASSLLATDERDKVYAFLGLAEELNGTIEPNYSLTVQETFSRFAEALVSVGLGGSLVATTGLARITMEGLPTWCMDLSYAGEHSTSLFQYAKVYKWLLRASGDLSGSYVVSHDRSELTVSGVILDTIKSHGLTMLERPELADVENILHWLQTTREFLTQLAENGSWSSSLRELFLAFCRLVVADDVRFAVDSEEIHLAFTRQKLSLYKTLLEKEPEKRLQGLRDLELPTNLRDYEHCFRNVTGQRKVCITSKGYLGLVRDQAQAGDEVCVVLGCNVPVIIRRAQTNDDRRLLIGDSFFLDLMNGEALSIPDVSVEEIVLK